MLAYKQYANIDAQGTLILQNLPFRNHKLVEVVVLINDVLNNPMQVEQKIQRLKMSFGTIKSDEQIPDEVFSRENIYGEDGR